MSWIIFAVALLARLLYGLSQHNLIPHEYLFYDSFLYDYSARLIAEGDRLGHIAELSLPLRKIYLAFLAGCYSLAGHQTWLPRLVQILLGSLGCVLIGGIAKKVWNKQVGIAAGLISALYGIFIFYDLELVKPSLANFFLILAIYCLVRRSGRISAMTIIVSSFALSISVLLRAQVLIIAPAIALWILIYYFTQGRPRAVILAILFLGLISLFPMLINTGLSYWIPKSAGFSSMGGIHLYIGNHAEANGSYSSVRDVRSDPYGHYYGARELAERDAGKVLNDKEVNDYWYAKAWKVICDNPVGWLRLEIKKMRMILNYMEIPSGENYPYTRKASWFLRLPLLSYSVVCPLALLGLVYAIRSGNRLSLLIVLGLLSYAGILLMTFVTSAYRMPLQPLMILFAASAVISLKDLIVTKKYVRLVFSIACLGVFFVLSNSRPVLPEELFEKNIKEKERALQLNKGREVQYLIQSLKLDGAGRGTWPLRLRGSSPA